MMVSSGMHQKRMTITRFSTSEVFEKVSCNYKIDDVIKCPFREDCNSSPLWDAISDYIRKGIETYEKAKDLEE